ncbi:MAG: aldo/keto reductase [Roseofilum sp. Belize BBD 4]|uniref:aldo/keto reductase n=1 Tax=Roseofilum sp. Belize BBD 4 TaxID=2821500 RepID=UPI000E951AE3|nr:aldo/keto reductase [Roseofilum sp. Belize BBD 4]MBP0034682.1 aldo/keto reductase [Roseofilum sp. Belize BBD 4]HBQ97730.1 aldo/keto reductase [Cyanobacteria bacterium UBA11691]
MASTSTLSLPKMGCGTWAWGNRLLWQYDPTMDRDLQKVFNLCVSNGITLFDTGDSYGTGKFNGQSEKLLGQFAQGCIAANIDSLCIATKLAPYPWRLTRNAMVQAGESSAQRLQRPIDLVQMHWSTANYAPWQEWALLDGLADLYEQGKAKAVGLSNYGPKRLQKVVKHLHNRGISVLTLQVQYSLLSTAPVTQLNLKAVCDDLGIQLIAYSPLALGLLTGKYTESGPLPQGLRKGLFQELLPQVKPVLECLHAIAKFHHKTSSQVALNWCMAKGTMPIPGAKNPRQAQENIGALGWSLTPGEVDELDRAAAGLKKGMVKNIFQTG